MVTVNDFNKQLFNTAKDFKINMYTANDINNYWIRWITSKNKHSISAWIIIDAWLLGEWLQIWTWIQWMTSIHYHWRGWMTYKINMVTWIAWRKEYLKNMSGGFIFEFQMRNLIRRAHWDVIYVLTKLVTILSD